MRFYIEALDWLSRSKELATEGVKMAKQATYIDAVVALVEQELVVYPQTLRGLGYRKREWEAAVKQGRIRWAKDGSLQPAAGVPDYR